MEERNTLTVSILIAAVCLLGATRASAAVKVRAGRVNPIVVDGSIGDWAGVPTQYFDKGPRLTAIAHDGRFLYVHFRYSDLSLARRVLETGAIVWINGDGDHEASFGLRYRGTKDLEKALRALEGPRDESASGGAPSDGPYGGEGRRGHPPGMGPKLDHPPLGALEVLHLGVVDEVISPSGQAAGASAACGMVDGAFAYELRAELTDLSPAAQLGGVKAPTHIAIGFQMGGITPAELKAMRERMRSGGGPPEGGPGGRSGGGPPGGFGGGPEGGGPPGGGGPMGPEGNMKDSEIVWVDVELVDVKTTTPTSP